MLHGDIPKTAAGSRMAAVFIIPLNIKIFSTEAKS
jgi:hypothetical protein